MEESTVTGVQRAKRKDFHTEDWCRPALTNLRGLSTHPLGWVMSATEARASQVRSQGEDWGWLCEHSLKEARASQLAWRETRIMVIGTYTWKTNLNVNGLNAPTKRPRLAEWIQKQDPYICCLQETYFTPRDIQTGSEGMENIYSMQMDIKRKLE